MHVAPGPCYFGRWTVGLLPPAASMHPSSVNGISGLGVFYNIVCVSAPRWVLCRKLSVSYQKMCISPWNQLIDNPDPLPRWIFIHHLGNTVSLFGLAYQSPLWYNLMYPNHEYTEIYPIILRNPKHLGKSVKLLDMVVINSPPFLVKWSNTAIRTITMVFFWPFLQFCSLPDPSHTHTHTHTTTQHIFSFFSLWLSGAHPHPILCMLCSYCLV